MAQDTSEATLGEILAEAARLKAKARSQAKGHALAMKHLWQLVYDLADLEVLPQEPVKVTETQDGLSVTVIVIPRGAMTEIVERLAKQE